MKKLSGGVLALFVLVSLQIACGSFAGPEEVVVVPEAQPEADFQGHDPFLFELATVQAEQATQIAKQQELLEYLFTIVPREAAGSMDGTPEPTAYSPVRGSVIIEDDNCCAGGTVGDTIELNIQFEAMSPSGDVTQMRYLLSGAIASEADLESVEWTDYREAVAEEIEISTANWVGYWVSVQYMDTEGNVSPVYVDDISIEGMPAPTP